MEVQGSTGGSLRKSRRAEAGSGSGRDGSGISAGSEDYRTDRMVVAAESEGRCVFVLGWLGESHRMRGSLDQQREGRRRRRRGVCSQVLDRQQQAACRIMDDDLKLPLANCPAFLATTQPSPLRLLPSLSSARQVSTPTRKHPSHTFASVASHCCKRPY